MQEREGLQEKKKWLHGHPGCRGDILPAWWLDKARGGRSESPFGPLNPEIPQYPVPHKAAALGAWDAIRTPKQGSSGRCGFEYRGRRR